MASTDPNPNARRLRWALMIALGLHLLLAWRFMPNLSTTFAAVRKAISSDEVVEIKAPPPLMSRNMAMSGRLGEASSRKLPKGFFGKPKGMKGGRLEISDDLDFSRRSGVQIVASIVPGALKTRSRNALSEPQHTPAPQLAAPPSSPQAEAADTTMALAVAEMLPPAAQPAPFLLPEPPQPEPMPEPEPVREVDVDAVIARAADEAERNAREARNASSRQPAPDYRALLPPPTARTEEPPSPRPRESRSDPTVPGGDSSITTFALDASAVSPRRSAAPPPPDGNAAAAARQQFFAQLTARLKTANGRALAEALKAGPRTTVRMSFMVDRDGSVVGISPGDPVSRELAERAATVIRLARLPPVPASMTEVPLELSFPIEVYR